MSTLYSSINSKLNNTIEANTTEDATVINQTFTYISPKQLYAQIVPEKPSILAEERIFVYVPKVAFNTAGIAKFAPSQFNVVNTEVSLKPEFIDYIQDVITFPPLVVSATEPSGYQLWYKVISSIE